MAESNPSTGLAVSDSGGAALPAAVTPNDGALQAAGGSVIVDGADNDSIQSEKESRWAFLANPDVLKQISLIIGLTVVLLVAIVVVIWSQETEYRPLGEFATDELIQTLDHLDQQKIPYRLEGSVIHVPASEFQNIRLNMARAGLTKAPANGSDLLMQDMGFGVSQRLEGERLKLAREQMLARTIEQLNPVKQARVLLALPRESVFATRTRKPGATVVVTLARGYTLRQEEVDSVVDIVASAVDGMDPSRVTVTDQNGRLLHSGSQDPASARSRREYELERQREVEYIDKIDAILIPVLGIDKYTAQVDVNMDFTEVEQTQRRFDPQNGAVRSEMLMEQRSQGAQNSGIPGALSNQPPAASSIPQELQELAGSGIGGPSSSVSEATRNYEVDTTVSHTRQQAGVLRRLSVSVALDYIQTTNAAGETVLAPRSPEQMASIQRLLQGGLGFDAQRGDTLEVVSVPFAQQPLGAAGPAGPIWEAPWFASLVRVVAGALVVIVLLLAVVRPMVRRLLPAEPENSELALAGGGTAADGGEFAGALSNEERALLGEDDTDLLPQLTEEDALLDTIRAIVNDEPGVAARVLRNWMVEDA